MVVVPDGQSAEWVELDEWGRVGGKRFRGTVSALQSHIRTGITDAAVQLPPTVKDVWVSRPLCDTERSTLLEVCSPWGTYRWIPRPRDPAEDPRPWWDMLSTRT
jgi:hypothetical protein